MKFFRQLQNSLEQGVKGATHNESALKQSSFWMQSISWGLMITTGFAVTWLAVAKTEEIVVALGKLEPVGSVRDIQMPVGGIVDEIFVKDGDKVVAGQVVMLLDTEASKKNNESLLQKVRLKQEQISLKNEEIVRLISLNDDSIFTLTQKLSFENEILDRYGRLAEIGASSELQYLQQRNTVQDVEGRLRKQRIDGIRNVTILKQDLQRLRSEIASLNSELTQTEVQLRYEELKSPVGGIVFDLIPSGPGYTAQRTETIMKIVPLNSLEAKVEIPSSDIGFVSKGMPVDVSIDSFPATDFGVIEGVVEEVGYDALPPDRDKRQIEYSYPAKISLNTQQLILNDGKKLALQSGMSLTANIKLRKVTYLQLLLGTFRNKVDSLREI